MILITTECPTDGKSLTGLTQPIPTMHCSIWTATGSTLTKPPTASWNAFGPILMNSDMWKRHHSVTTRPILEKVTPMVMDLAMARNTSDSFTKQPICGAIIRCNWNTSATMLRVLQRTQPTSACRQQISAPTLQISIRMAMECPMDGKSPIAGGLVRVSRVATTGRLTRTVPMMQTGTQTEMVLPTSASTNGRWSKERPWKVCFLRATVSRQNPPPVGPPPTQTTSIPMGILYLMGGNRMGRANGILPELV